MSPKKGGECDQEEGHDEIITNSTSSGKRGGYHRRGYKARKRNEQ